MSAHDHSKNSGSWCGRLARDGWLVGVAMLAIVCAIASPFVMSFFGYGVPYKAAGAHGPLFEASDVFIVIGVVFSARCIGWAVSKLVGRWISRAGGPPRGWIRFLLEVASYAAILLIGYSLQMKQSYIHAVIVGCAVMVMLMVAEAFRGKRDAP